MTTLQIIGQYIIWTDCIHTHRCCTAVCRWYSVVCCTQHCHFTQAWLEHCNADLDAWFCFNSLCLNPSKHKAILLGTHQRLLSFPTVPSVNIASSPVTVTDQSQPLASLLTNISPLILMFLHSATLHFHLRDLRHIHSFLTEDTAASTASAIVLLGIVELCAKILQIMRNDFKDYARTFCQLCAPFSIQISINQERK